MSQAKQSNPKTRIFREEVRRLARDGQFGELARIRDQMMRGFHASIESPESVRYFFEYALLGASEGNPALIPRFITEVIYVRGHGPFDQHPIIHSIPTSEAEIIHLVTTACNSIKCARVFIEDTIEVAVIPIMYALHELNTDTQFCSPQQAARFWTIMLSHILAPVNGVSPGYIEAARWVVLGVAARVQLSALVDWNEVFTYVFERFDNSTYARAILNYLTTHTHDDTREASGARVVNGICNR